MVTNRVTTPFAFTLGDLSHRVLSAALPVATTGHASNHLTPAVSALTLMAPSHQILPKVAQAPSGMDTHISRYDLSTKTLYSNPEAYVSKFPTSWEANSFREGKYPPLTTFVPGSYCPQIAGSSSSNQVDLGTYASAVAGSERLGRKGKKCSPMSGANQVVVPSKPLLGELKRKTLPGVECPFFRPSLYPCPSPERKRHLCYLSRHCRVPSVLQQLRSAPGLLSQLL